MTGRQPISGLTPASWYSFIVSWLSVSLSPLCFFRSSEIRGVNAVIARCVCICLMNRGTRMSRIRTTSTMIVSNQVTPLVTPNAGLNRLNSCVMIHATALLIGARMVFNGSVPLLCRQSRPAALLAGHAVAAPDPGRPDGTDDTGSAACTASQLPRQHHAPGSPPAHTHCTTGRTGNAARAPG